MTTYFKDKAAPITADMTIYSSDCLSVAEMRELDEMDADDLIAYAEAVPGWDYIDDGMWDYIAYWTDTEIPEDPDDWDPNYFLAAAKGELPEEDAPEAEYDDDGNLVKTTFDFDPYDDNTADRIDLDAIDVGTPVLVIRSENLMTGKHWYSLLSDDQSIKYGCPGNVDPSICAFHGWCGTTDDIYVSAEGVHIIKAIDTKPNGWVTVTIAPEDIKADED